MVGVSAGVGRRALASISMDEACGLLHALDLGKYESGFRSLPVNGSVLDAAEEGDLIEVPTPRAASLPPTNLSVLTCSR